MPAKFINFQNLRSRLTNRFFGSIKGVRTQEPVIALTFDDGPHPEHTPRLLDILQQHGAHATFFMVGKAAEQHPQLVRRVAEAGHTIGNHGWDHTSFPLLSSTQRRAQIRRCAAVLAPHGQRLFRPPYGHQNPASRLDAWLLGYEVVGWNVMAHDWLDHDAEWMLETVRTDLKNGSIVLLHDALQSALEERFKDRGTAFTVVERLLVDLKNQYRFVSLVELLQTGAALKQPWFRTPDAEWIARLA